MSKNPGIPEAEFLRLEEQKARLVEAAKAKEHNDQQTGRGGRHGPPAKKKDNSVDQLTIDTIVPRLEKRFGLGDRPATRSKFYRRLAEIVSVYGQAAYEAVSLAAAQASSARQPGRYFCASAKVILAERGIFVEPAVVVSDW